MKRFSIAGILVVVLLSACVVDCVVTRSTSRYSELVTINKNYQHSDGQKGILAKLVISEKFEHLNMLEIAFYNLVRLKDGKFYQWTNREIFINNLKLVEKCKFVPEFEKGALLLAIKKSLLKK